MKIEVGEFFKEKYKTCYLLTNKEPRRLCILIGKDNSRLTMSYARYQMQNHLGRFLSKDEQVDHVDNNKLNDVIENYQILNPKDNNIKKIEHLGIKEKMIKFKCPICNKEFERRTHVVWGKTNVCCSRKCGGIKSHLILKNKEISV